LDATFRGRTRAQLINDPIYLRYLSPDDFHVLFEQSTASGEIL
jgi:hypothetical protein